MGTSRREECFEDNNAIVDTPPHENMSGEQQRKVENLSHKNIEIKTPSESEGISEIEAKSETTNDGEILQDGELAGLAVSIKEYHGYGAINNYWNLLKYASFSVKGDNKTNKVSALWTDLLESHILKLKTLQGNTMLHMLAEMGDEYVVKKIVREAPYLLTVRNWNGDTALHVAAKAGHFSVLKKLITAHFKNPSENYHIALEKILEKNNEGNTFFHEALINSHEGVMNFLLSHGGKANANLKVVAKAAASTVMSNENKSGLYLAIEFGYKHVVDQILSEVIPKDPTYVPLGKSLLLAAIIKRDQDILDTILTKKPEWIHLMDTEGRVPLHYAASIGYLKGVQYLLDKCASCVIERDNRGYLPIHLASHAGHVSIVQELLKSKNYPDPREILHIDGRNILHLAAQSGKFSVVKYILQASDYGLQKMINEQDCNGNTPLHLATMCCHPKIVHALTWDKRVGLALVNRKGQTALDVFKYSENLSLRECLVWIALKSVGGVVHLDEPKSMAIEVPPESTYEFMQQEGPDMEPFQERINTLVVVSTLIITATFATGFTLPGGINGSGDPGPGMAVMLHHIWFKIFIFCIAISMYGAITVTIILIWAKLGDRYVATYSVQVAMPLLGITLGTLSLAFLAGVHLVIRDLTWLDTSFLAIGLLFILVLLLLYTMQSFPSSTSNLVARYISYYPFLLLASFVEMYEY